MKKILIISSSRDNLGVDVRKKLLKEHGLDDSTEVEYHYFENRKGSTKAQQKQSLLALLRAKAENFICYLHKIEESLVEAATAAFSKVGVVGKVIRTHSQLLVELATPNAHQPVLVPIKRLPKESGGYVNRNGRR